MAMTELEKLEAGLPYDFHDPAVNARKLGAVQKTAKLNSIPVTEHARRTEAIRDLFGKVGKDPEVLPVFQCDNGKNIFVGDDFLANYNVTILDIAKVIIGDHVMIGPNTLIITVNHPLAPSGRRNHIGIASPIHIGNDVWIGGQVVILPGITIGNNVIIAAGAVVTHDVPDNTLVAGVPARKLKTLPNDV
jgi:maltose O-acetyltransferase